MPFFLHFSTFFFLLFTNCNFLFLFKISDDDDDDDDDADDEYQYTIQKTGLQNKEHYKQGSYKRMLLLMYDHS